MCIAIDCYSACDVKNFEINLIFLIKTFLNKNLNTLKTKRDFKAKKVFFITFKGLSVVKNCLRIESLALKKYLCYETKNDIVEFY